MLSLSLLVINPVFLLENKLGFNSASMLHCVMMAVLLCFFAWYRKRRFVYFILGAFLLGIGLSIRVWFAWFIVVLFTFTGLYYYKISGLLKSKATLYILTGVIAFSLGSVFFILYNLTAKLATLRFVIDGFNLSGTNADSGSYLNHLLKQLHVFSGFISGQWSIEEQGSWFHRSWSYPEPFVKFPVNNMLMWVFMLVFYGCQYHYYSKKFFSKKRVLFICGLILIIILLSPLVSSRLAGSRLFILYPFLMITIALALVDVIKRNKYLGFFAVSVFCITMFFNVKTFLNWQYYFEYTGGIGNNSDAIYALVDWLKAQQIKEPLVCDWGMEHNLISLGSGKIEPRVVYGLVKAFPYGKGEEDMFFIANCRKYFINSSFRYIYHTPAFTNLNRFDVFTKIAHEMGKEVSEEKIFHQRDGKPIFIVYSVK